MRRFLTGSIGLAVAFNGSLALARSTPEVIASSGPAPVGATVATIGAPQPLSATRPQPASSGAIYRGQKDDKPVAPPVTSDPGPVPLPAPMPIGPPMGESSLVPPTAIVPSLPCQSCMPGPFIPSFSPLPGGIFARPNSGPNRWYVSGDYLYWWIRDGGLPPLVTTGPVGDPATTTAGVLGAPGTVVLFGNSGLDTQGRSGARFEVGRWFGECRPWAIEGGFFFLGQRSADYHAEGDGSAGSAVIARPFFETNRGVESVEYINFPGIFSGAIDIRSTNNFYGANLDFRRKLWHNCGLAVDGQIGFRYLHLDEDLEINERSTFVTAGLVNTNGIPIPVGTTSFVQDRFKVENDFYGAMFGVVTDFQRGPWSLQLLTRLSLGTTHERVEINGGQQVVPPSVAPPGNFSGGLLARDSNIGVYTADKFAVVPEAGLTVGYQFTPNWKATLGYSFLYWSNVVRVGDQIDRSVNLQGIPFALQPPAVPAGERRPVPILKETDFWAQGVNVGLQRTW